MTKPPLYPNALQHASAIRKGRRAAVLPSFLAGSIFALGATIFFAEHGSPLSIIIAVFTDLAAAALILLALDA